MIEVFWCRSLIIRLPIVYDFALARLALLELVRHPHRRVHQIPRGVLFPSNQAFWQRQDLYFATGAVL